MSAPVLFNGPISKRELSRLEAAPLLDEEVTICFKNSEGALDTLALSVIEVFSRCQSTLSESLKKPVELVIKGSSVASLFSHEPYEDIDVHCVVDLTYLEEGDRIREGNLLKWTLINAIAQLATEKLKKKGRSEVLDSSSILHKEESNLLSIRPNKTTGKTEPFDTHSIALGSRPIEITLFCITKPIDKTRRNFDFNSGHLSSDFYQIAWKWAALQEILQKH